MIYREKVKKKKKFINTMNTCKTLSDASTSLVIYTLFYFLTTKMF